MSHWIDADSFDIGRGPRTGKFTISLTAPHDYGDRLYLELEPTRADLELIHAAIERELAPTNPKPNASGEGE